MLLKICITPLTVSHPIPVPSPRRGADSIGQMGVEEPLRQSRQSGVGSFPRAAAASGIHPPIHLVPRTKQKSFSSSHSRFEKANLIRAPVSHHPSGIMNRHDPRRRSPQTATVAAASMRSRVRRRIRAATCGAILPIRAVRLALCPALLPNN